MSWIEFHTVLRDHWKVKRLANLLQVEYPQALGHLACLWCWVAQHAPKGNVKNFTDAELCEGARIKTNLNLKNILKQVSLMDANERIHDWGKHGIKLLESRRKRQRKYVKSLRRRLRRHDALSTECLPLPNLTLPNHNIKKYIKKNFDQLVAFDEVFKDYPNKVREGFARNAFFSVIFSEEIFERFKKALEVYKGHLKTNEWKKAMEFTKWLQEWDQWENFKEPERTESERLKDAKTRDDEIIAKLGAKRFS